MKKNIPATYRTSALVITFICTLFFFQVYAQQHIIADKDNTHPELKTQDAQPAFMLQLAAERGNGYNEVAWKAVREDDIRKYIVEYSTNGIDYQSAGEVVRANGTYLFKHHLLDNSPVIYRIKSEQMNSRFFYSDAILLMGARLSPVKLFPTVVQGNMINIDSYWPVERINVFASNGALVFAKDLNGQKDYISLLLPSLSRGMYWMAFQGRGWKTTEKFIIQ